MGVGSNQLSHYRGVTAKSPSAGYVAVSLRETISRPAYPPAQAEKTSTKSRLNISTAAVPLAKRAGYSASTDRLHYFKLFNEEKPPISLIATTRIHLKPEAASSYAPLNQQLA
jgi:hypothetical protein